MEATFSNIDLGSPKPISVRMETVQVEIPSESLLGDFAHAFVTEGYRKNPLLAEQVQLTEEEMDKYVHYLIYQRVLQVNDQCVNYRKNKNLYIPAFIQHLIAQVGVVIVRDLGLKFMPVMECADVITFDEALVISDKVGAFERDLAIVIDGFPRSVEGDIDLMSSAVIADYVRTIKPVSHVMSTYLAAFLNLKLREESVFKVLYRVQYDDVDFIKSALLGRKELF